MTPESNKVESNINSPKETTVMLLAAGEGSRMLPLTKTTPKPLLKVGELSLLEHHLDKLSKLGFDNIVINTAHLGSQIQKKIGDGRQFNLTIQYSDESNTGALETAGGIINALPLISSHHFIVVNSDIWTDYNFTALLTPLESHQVGRIVLVNNPEHNLFGDFCIDSDNLLREKGESVKNTYTFSGIALYQKSIFNSFNRQKKALAPILRQLISQNLLGHRLHHGVWTDVGTPERLAEINSTYHD